MLIDLTEPDDVVAPENGINLVGMDAPQTPSLPDAKRRAAKAHFGLGQDSPGPDMILESIVNGDEPVARLTSANKERTLRTQERTEMLSQMVLDGALKPDQAEAVVQYNAEPIFIDPQTHWERKYAEQFVDTSMTINDTKEAPFQTAMFKRPEETLMEMGIASNLITRREAFAKIRDDAKNTIGAQSWPASIYHTLEQFVPLLSNYRLRNAVDLGPKVGDLLPGDNLAGQVDKLHRMPVDDAVKALDLAVKKLAASNPYDAMRLAEAAVKFSTSDVVVDNVFGVVDVASVFPSATVAKFARKGQAPVKIAEEAGRYRVGDWAKLDQKTGRTDNLFAPKVAETVEPKKASSYKLSPEAEADANALELSRSQGELFGEEQYALRGLDLNESTKPPMEPGRLRSTHVPISDQEARADKYPTRDLITGRMIRRPTQLDMELHQFPVQQSLDLKPPAPKGPPVNDRGTLDLTMPEVRKALADTVKATDDRVKDVPEMLAEVGDVQRSATLAATRDVEARAVATKPTMPTDITREVPSIFNPDLWYSKSPGNLAREARQRLTNRATEVAQQLMTTLGTVARANRLPEEVRNAAVAIATKEVRAEYKQLNHAIVDVEWLPAQYHPANVDTVKLVLGKTDATPFETSQIARYHARNYGLKDDTYYIEQKGQSFQIAIERPVRETDDILRDSLVTTENVTPKNLSTMLFAKAKSAEDLVSDFQRNNRHISTHAPQELRKNLLEIAKDITSLSKKSRQDVLRTLEMGQTMVDPVTKKAGMFFQTNSDFEKAFDSLHKRLPTAAETQAYNTYVQLSDFDYLLRNLGWYRDKARQGRVQKSFRYEDANGKPKDSEWFEAIPEKDIAWAKTEDENILIWDSASKTSRFESKHNNPAFKAEVDDLVKNKGYKVVRIGNPLDRPMLKMTEDTGKRVDDIIHYVVTDGFDTKPISFKQAEYRGGGHWIYADQWYVKQGKVATGTGGKEYYWGDKTLHSASSEAEALRLAQSYETARSMMNSGNTNLGQYVQKNLGMTEQAFKDQFTKGGLDPNLPILHTYSGRRTAEQHPDFYTQKYGKDFRDYTKSTTNPDAALDSTYLQDRDELLMNIKETGTVANPMYSLEKAKLLDPFAALNQSLGQSVRAVWMNDYKIGAVESWIAEFGNLMKLNPDSLRSNPFFHFYHPDYQTNVGDRAKLAAAQASRTRILNFLGVETELGRDVRWMEQKLQNTIYENLGQSKAQWTQEHLLGFEKDPFTYTRSMAFHTKLGMFNPAQLLIQAQTLTHVLAVAGPREAFKGFAGNVLLHYASKSDQPAVIDHFAQMATKFGWKADDWKEMMTAHRASGIGNVGGETAWRDDVFDPKLFKSMAGTFLDKGTMFFQSGERAVRNTAFATAYSEWRSANPGKKFDTYRLNEIMTRADTLSLNMTRASNSALQEGFFSVPSQFLTFNQRMAEQMMPFYGRLSTKEKLSAYTTYSALYGVPVAASIPLIGEPLYDDIREAALSRGIKINEGWMKLATEGLMDVALSAATGRDYDVAKRMGPGANSLFRDVRTGEKGFLDVVFGASGTLLADAFKAVYPAHINIANAIKGNDAEYPMTLSDWTDAARNISTVNNAYKAYFASAFHNWVTKNNVVVSDKVDTIDGVFAILGLSPQHVIDTFLKNDIKKSDKEVKSFYENHASKDIRYAMEAMSANDRMKYDVYMKRVNASLRASGMSEKEKGDFFRKSMQEGYAPLEDKVNKDFWMKGPAPLREPRLNQFLQGN